MPRRSIEKSHIAALDVTYDWDRLEGLIKAEGERELVSRVYTRFWENLRNPEPGYVDGVLARLRDRLDRSGTAPLVFLVGLSQLDMTGKTFELIDQASFSHMFDPAGPSPNAETVAMNSAFIFNHSNRAMIRDIRFVRLCAKLGLCDYWVETGRWPDCVDQVSYDFKAEARRLAAI